jgi:activator of HSP90 ATPase
MGNTLNAEAAELAEMTLEEQEIAAWSASAALIVGDQRR